MESKQGTSEKLDRKPYSKPCLCKLGTVTDLTWAGTGGASDGGMPMAAN